MQSPMIEMQTIGGRKVSGKTKSDGNRTYRGVDVLKFLFALCILAIHCRVLNGQMGEYVYPMIFRLGVPYFFVASGFFLAKKLYLENRNRKHIVKQYCYRLLIKLTFFEAINLILKITYSIYQKKAAGEIALESIRSVLFYPEGALWYLQATLVAVLLIAPIIKKKKEFLIIPLGVALYGLGSLANRYYFMIEGSCMQKWVDIYLSHFISARNGLFYGFLFVGMGVLIAKNSDSIQVWVDKAWLFVLLSFILLGVENGIIMQFQGADDNAMYLMHVLLIPSIFILSLSIRIPVETRLFRNLSTSIYLLHRPILFVIETMFLAVTGEGLSALTSMVVVLLTIILICLPVYRYRIKYIYHLIV